MGHHSIVVLLQSGSRRLQALLGAFGIVVALLLPAVSAAEASGSDPIIKVTLIGTGTPVPNPRQNGPAVLVEAAGEKLLFDCGRGCASTLWNLDHDYLRETQHLFLTHMHSDHTVGIADLYMNGWNLGRTAALNVYGPAAAEDHMKYIRLAFEEDVVFRVEKQNHAVTREGLSHAVHVVKDGTKVEIGDVTVTTIAVDHYVIEPAFGYRVDVGGHSVVISGDTAYSQNLVRQSAGADVLIHEVFSPALERFVRKTFPEDVADDIVALHTLAPDVGRAFENSDIKLGVLTHLDNSPAHVDELLEQVATSWDGDVVVGEDQMVIDIGSDVRIRRPVSKE